MKETGFADAKIPMSGELQQNLPRAGELQDQTMAMHDAFPQLSVPKVRSAPYQPTYQVEKEDGETKFLGFHDKEKVVGQPQNGEVNATGSDVAGSPSSAVSDTKNKKLAYAIVFAMLLFGGALFTGSGYRKESDKTKKSRLLIITFMLASGGFGSTFYAWKEYNEDKIKKKGSSTQEESMVLKTRSAPDPIIAPNPPEPRMRPRAWNTEMQTGEGPKPGLRYEFENPPDNMKRLGIKDLMRNTGGPQMTDEEMKKYMARLEGYAVDQYHGVDPSMAFAAERSHFVHNNDDEKVYHIGGEPGRYQTKWPARDPRIDQAGAQRMHLKDLPPGVVPPAKSEVHPWMEQDMSGKEPPVMLNNDHSEKQSAHEITAQYMQETNTLYRTPPASKSESVNPEYRGPSMQPPSQQPVSNMTPESNPYVDKPINVRKQDRASGVVYEREELGGMQSQKLDMREPFEQSRDQNQSGDLHMSAKTMEKGRPVGDIPAPMHHTVDEFDDGQDLKTSDFESFFQSKPAATDEELQNALNDIRR